MKSEPHQICRPAGFTLVELVIVIVIIGILATVAGIFIRGPIDAYLAQSNRAALVDAANMALARISRDLRAALPNSIRTPGANAAAIEMINTIDGARYRTGPGTGGSSTFNNPTDWLSFNKPDDQFNILGNFSNLNGACCSSNVHMVIYNVGVPGADAYNVGASPNVITPNGTSITISNSLPEAHVTLNPPFQFAYDSPRHRAYLIDTPISWVCNLSAGTLTRYIGYPISAVEPVPPAAGTASVHAGGVTGCAFNYVAGTSTRSGIVTLKITVTRNNETVSLLNQIHVSNAP